MAFGSYGTLLPGNFGGSDKPGKKPGSSFSESTSSGGTYFQDPEAIAQLANIVGSLGGSAAANYMDTLANPAGSSLFTSQLQGLLKSLLPSEEAARQSLADTFRAAGGVSGSGQRSGAFASEAGKLEDAILGQRMQGAGNGPGANFH